MINALRSALYLAVQVITVIPYALVLMLFAVAPLHWRYWFAAGWPRFMIWCARWICGIGWSGDLALQASVDLGKLLSAVLHAA